MAETKPAFADFTPDKVTEAKAKYAALKSVTVTLKDGSKENYVIAQPSRAVLDMISKYFSENKDHKVREVLNANCILAGNMDVINNPLDTSPGDTVYGKITEWVDKLQIEEKEL